MNKKLLSVSLLLVGLQSYSQVGIGTLTPNQSAQLDVVSNNKGILIPRVRLTSSKDASTIQKGNVNSLLVFNTNTQNDVTPGYYYWYDDRWMRIVNDADVVALDKNTTNQSLTVVGGDLVLTDSDGNMVSVPITDLNIPETETTIVDNGTSFTYTNELNNPVTIDLLQGPVGPQGPIGLTGPAGADGATGPQGPIGLTGPQGPQGIAGADGATGSQGPQGIAGVDGADGATGPQGPIGLTGPQGIAGVDGADGATGPQGPIGLTGPAGADGATGPRGIAGVDGADGATGPQGPQGIAGVDGADGATGPQGPIGLTGPQGPIGLTGPAGADGATGPQGPIGLTGPAGADGSVVTADNGLNKSTATNIQLGGALLKATEIATNAAHTLAISGLQPGSATDEIVVVGTDGVLKKVAQTTGVNIYNADGTLTGNRTVTQNNQNLTFTTGTARTIVNGNFQMGGAVYANVRTHSASTNVAWTDTDYVVILTNNGITGTLELPNPKLHSGRILSIRNNTGSLVAFGGPSGSNTIPLNNSTIASGSGYTYISDGTNWHPTGSR